MVKSLRVSSARRLWWVVGCHPGLSPRREHWRIPQAALWIPKQPVPRAAKSGPNESRAGSHFNWIPEGGYPRQTDSAGRIEA